MYTLQKSVAGEPASAHQSGKDGYVDWVILTVQGFKEYLEHDYRKLMDVLREMPASDPDPSVELYDLGDVQPVDITGVDRVQASQHYAKWIDYMFEAVKTTLLVDCETSTILDIHFSMKQPHDTQVGWQILVRNLDDLTTVAADKGYD